MSIDYGEIVCTAIDEIVTAKLQGLQYDITKLCTIIDDTYSYQGRYTVSDGTARYEAFSDNTSFKNGNNVLVVIPNGDYTMQKTITGRVAAADTTPFNYTSPMDTMIKITNNVFDNPNALFKDNVGLLANDGGEERQGGTVIGPLYSISESADFAGFTRLGMTADFRSWLTGLDVVEGIYGLKVLIYTEISNAPGSVNKNAVYELTFNSTDMVGNPYQFESFFSQEKVFDISNINNIKQIDVYFYQNGQFKNGSGNLIPWQNVSTIFEGNQTIELTSNKPNNLFVDNVKIYLGYETGAFSGETLMLYTPDSTTYHYNHTNLEKNISLRWIHKVSEKEYQLLNDIDLRDEKYEICWFRHHPGWEIIDQYAGKDWEEVGVIGELKNSIINLKKEQEYKISQLDENSGEYNSKLKEIQDYYSEEIQKKEADIEEAKENNLFKYSFTPNLEKQTELIKVVGIIREDDIETAYYSNLLIFENEEEVPDKLTVDASTALSIKCLDNTEGNYYIYNQNGKINNEGIGRGYKRYLKAMYQGAEITNTLGELEWIKWYIPSSNTSMLMATEEFEKESGGKKLENEVNYKGVSYKVIERKATKNEIGKSELNVLQAYSIDNQWDFQKSNNTIRCQVKIGNNIYDAIEELRFGKAGSNGTDITFLIEFENNQNALLATVGSTVNVRARLYDAKGSRVDFTNKESKDITWDWYKKSSNEYITLDGNNNIATLTSKVDEIKDDNYYILKATYGELEAYLPIPLKTEDATFIEGAREVIYNHQGIPNYYTDAYLFYIWNEENLRYKKTEGGTWKLTHNGNDTGIKDDNPTLSNSYIPRLKSVPQTNYVALSASQFYAFGENDNICVSYLTNYKEKTYGWSQPILVMQSKYDFAMLNEWDGSLKIDENNGTILSTMLGAGRKNDDNTFSGVLIGDISAGTENNEASTQTGVYGLHEGVISYALKEDGTATFGKAGCGQVKIDGNKGQIFSPNYFDKEDEKDIGEGMLIDLDDGSFSIKDNGQSKINIQPSSSSGPHLIINGNNQIPLIAVGENSYILQSYTYKLHDGTIGTHLDLNTGELLLRNESGSVSILDSSNDKNLFKIQNKDSKDLIIMNNEDYYLQSSGYQGKDVATIEENEVVYKLYDNKRTSFLNGDGTEPTKATSIIAIDPSNNVYNTENQGTSIGDKIEFKKTTLTKVVSGVTDQSNQKVSVDVTYEADEYKKNFILSLSPRYTNVPKSGLKVDLEQGYISGYDLRLSGYKPKGKEFFILDSSADKTPFSINDKFKVDWDGTVYCETVEYLGTKPSDGSTVINIDDHFYVTSGGGVGASSVNAGRGNFGGGWFGGTAAKVAITGSSVSPFATINNDGEVGKSDYADINLQVMEIKIKALEEKVATLQNQMDTTEKSNLLAIAEGAMELASNVNTKVNDKVSKSAFNNHKHYVSGAAGSVVDQLVGHSHGSAPSSTGVVTVQTSVS